MLTQEPKKIALLAKYEKGSNFLKLHAVSNWLSMHIHFTLT